MMILENTSRNMEEPRDRNKVHAEHAIRLAKQLANGTRPGVLATVDENGCPQVRWMATLSLREFPHLYSLTSPKSRKVEHIRMNPKVSWMFTTEGSTMVVNMAGTATIVTDKTAVNRIWEIVEDKSNAFFLTLDCSEGVTVIDTLIEDIECVAPRYDLHYPPKKEDYPLLSP